MFGVHKKLVLGADFEVVKPGVQVRTDRLLELIPVSNFNSEMGVSLKARSADRSNVFVG